jgi:SAM-dependent methyltransferase
MNSNYLNFEDRFRGSIDLIRNKLSFYKVFIEILLKIEKSPKALDLGCGRGEWLEIIHSAGFIAEGVDEDFQKVEYCKNKGLKVTHANAVNLLQELEGESYSLISAFHFVEHLNNEELQLAISHSYRLLKPGGILIFETPNPENIIVATNLFYLDPTHKNPIPRPLLDFYINNAGFKCVSTFGLNEENSKIGNNYPVGIKELFYGVSPDYAIIGQKPGSKDLCNEVVTVIDEKVGIGFDDLVAKFDLRLLNIESECKLAQVKAMEAEAKAMEAEAKAMEAEAKIQNLIHDLERPLILKVKFAIKKIIKLTLLKVANLFRRNKNLKLFISYVLVKLNWYECIYTFYVEKVLPKSRPDIKNIKNKNDLNLDLNDLNIRILKKLKKIDD